MSRNLKACSSRIARAKTSNVLRVTKGKPPRLQPIFQRFDAPVFFVTFNTFRRDPILASPAVQEAFVEYCRRATEFGICVGRYAIMPDHVHLFVSFGASSEISLSGWVKGLKRRLELELFTSGRKPVNAAGQKLHSVWQPGFHDHLLRSEDSYAAKWDYVFQNPVRARLVAQAEDWPYAGEISAIARA